MKLLSSALRFIKGKRVVYGGCILLIFSIYFWNEYSENVLGKDESYSVWTQGEVCRIEGVVYKIEEKEYMQQIFAKTENNRFLVYDNAFTELQLGNEIVVKGEIELLEVARNKGNFDPQKYYSLQKIDTGITAKEIQVTNNKVYGIRNGLYHLRKLGIEKVYGILESDQAGLLVAMVFGEKNGMDSNQKELYQKVGISHIFAISGLHISLLSLVIYKYIRKCSGSFLLAGCVSGVVLALYIILIGMGISAIRAGIMFLMRVGADISGRVYDQKTSLGIAAIIILGINTDYIYEGSFLLSFGAILGVIYLVPIFKLAFPLEGIVTGLQVSLGIQLMLYPVMLYFFYEVSLYAVILNIIVIPIMTVLLGSGVIGILISIIWYEAGAVFVLFSGWLLKVIEFLSGISLSLPSSRIIVGQPWWIMIAIYYGSLGVLVIYSHMVMKVDVDEKKRRNHLRGVALVMCCLPVLMWIDKPASDLEITMLDIGQGDCFYIKGPDGTDCLIDGGSSDVNEVGKYRIEPFLKYQGVNRIEYAFISHGDQDHLNGIVEMIEREKVGIKIKNIVVCSQNYWDEDIQELVRIAQQHHISVRIIEEEQKLNLGELSIQCVAPPKDNVQTIHTLQTQIGNVTSMVLSLEYGEFKMLFTGDVEGDGEQYLEEKLKIDNEETLYTILKVAHHGSKNSTSKEFLSYINPRIALISAGVDNFYGHPHKETLEKLIDTQCHIYETAKNGGVMLSYNVNSDTIMINETVKP